MNKDFQRLNIIVNNLLCLADLNKPFYLLCFNAFTVFTTEFKSTKTSTAAIPRINHNNQSSKFT